MESKEVRGLMEAYASVYNQDLNEQKPEPEPGSPKNLMGGLSRLTGRGPLPKPERKGGRGPVVTLGGRGPVVKSMGEQSVFDIIKGHLLDEGYADTEQAALAIMANMSEEWKQSIVEDIRGLPYKPPVKRGGPMDEMMRGSRPNSGSSNGSSGAGMRDRDEPLWDSDQKPEDVKVTPTPTRPPVRKPQPTNKKDPPMRDEPLW